MLRVNAEVRSCQILERKKESANFHLSSGPQRQSSFIINHKLPNINIELKMLTRKESKKITLLNFFPEQTIYIYIFTFNGRCLPSSPAELS